METFWAVIAAFVVLNIVGFLGALAFVKLHRLLGRRRG